MQPIRVVIRGVSGKMGMIARDAISRESDMKLTGAVISSRRMQAGFINTFGIPVSDEIDTIITACKPDVMVDFTSSVETVSAVRLAAEKGIRLVIGTTGLTADELSEIERISRTYAVGIIVASNFALGAILMMHIAKIASRYMGVAEIIELHHDRKKDAPSGTAISTADTLLKSNEPAGVTMEGSARGEAVGNIRIHSIRLPGLMAHQETVLTTPGQVLTLRHDMIDRAGYAPGIMLAIREVMKRRDYTCGLDTLLQL